MIQGFQNAQRTFCSRSVKVSMREQLMETIEGCLACSYNDVQYRTKDTYNMDTEWQYEFKQKLSNPLKFMKFLV